MFAKGTLACALVALLLTGTHALAQSCIGVPVTDRGMALTGNASFGAEAKAYGAGVRANIQGPLSLGAGFAQMSPGFRIAGSADNG